MRRERNVRIAHRLAGKVECNLHKLSLSALACRRRKAEAMTLAVRSYGSAGHLGCFFRLLSAKSLISPFTASKARSKTCERDAGSLNLAGPGVAMRAAPRGGSAIPSGEVLRRTGENEDDAALRATGRQTNMTRLSCLIPRRNIRYVKSANGFGDVNRIHDVFDSINSSNGFLNQLLVIERLCLTTKNKNACAIVDSHALANR